VTRAVLPQAGATAAHQPATTLAEVLEAVGNLMKECHAESLSLQDALSISLPMEDLDLSRLDTYQQLDRMTQVNEDLSRLLPALALALKEGVTDIDHLANTLRLVSLRERLFTSHQPVAEKAASSGDVSFF
jgi:hypothetical protein